MVWEIDVATGMHRPYATGLRNPTALAIQPGWEAHVELAHLAERVDRTDDANRHYRAAAELSRR